MLSAALAVVRTSLTNLLLLITRVQLVTLRAMPDELNLKGRRKLEQLQLMHLKLT